MQTEILKTEGRQATPEDLKAKLDLEGKYDVTLITEEIASNSNLNLKAIGAKVVKKGSPYKFTVDEKLVITDVEIIGVEAGAGESGNKVQVSTPVIAENTGTPRGGRDLDQGTVYDGVTYNLGWADIAEIAKAISNTLLDSDNTNNISSDVSEFNLTYNGINYLLGVGDRMRIDGKIVRIMGFNHDDLVDTTVYGGINTKAGISFEYVNFIMENTAMNPSNNNTNGWAAMPLRSTLNNKEEGSVLAEVRNIVGANTIKQVKKEYVKTYNNAGTLQTGENASKDYLWLLGCSEIWNNGYESEKAGYSIEKEGEQYKYYKMINAIYNSTSGSSVYLRKPTSNGQNWWLRSTFYKDGYNNYFCFVADDGYCNVFYTNNIYGILPCFSV